MARPKMAAEDRRSVVVAVRMTPALAEAFDRVAKRWELSRSDAVLRLVKAQVEHERTQARPARSTTPRPAVQPRMKCGP